MYFTCKKEIYFCLHFMYFEIKNINQLPNFQLVLLVGKQSKDG